MANILYMMFLNTFRERNVQYFDQNCVTMSLIDNKSSLVEVMDWYIILSDYDKTITWPY